MSDGPVDPQGDLVLLGATNLNLLVPLLALLEERSISRAAARVGVSQRTMVHGLSQLRRMLGDELLVGSGARRGPTPRGAELLVPLRELLAQAAYVLDVASTTVPPTNDF